MSVEKTRGAGILNGGKTLLVFVVALTIVFVLISGCFDNSSGGSSGTTYSGSSSCGTGYHKYTTSAEHCCPEGYPHYYDGSCWHCREGSVYDEESGTCCSGDYPHYYDGKCHQCSPGYYLYATSAGHCCPQGYPYYYGGSCWNQPGGSGSTVQQTTSYYASCSQCPGSYSLYSYRGGSYETCNAYYQVCVIAGCGKILDNCR
jgi:hypothetical protein